MKRIMIKRWSYPSVCLFLVMCLAMGSPLVGVVTASSSGGSSGGSSSGSSEVTYSGSSLFTDWEQSPALSDFEKDEALRRLKERARALQWEFQMDVKNQQLWEAEWFKRHVSNSGTCVYDVSVTLPGNGLTQKDIRDVGGMLIQRYAQEETRKQKFLKQAAELYQFPDARYHFVELNPNMNSISAHVVTAATPQEFVQYLADPRFSLENPDDWNPVSDGYIPGVTHL